MSKPEKSYVLMNKDNEVLRFHSVKGEFAGDISFEQDVIIDNKLPIGFKDIDDWIIGRNASNHNEHIKRILERKGCNNNQAYIEMTHAASVSDTFWIKSLNEGIKWNDISLYRHSFTDIISQLSFEGAGVDTRFSPTSPTPEIVLTQTHSPELAVDGSFRRCFVKENRKGQYNSDVFLYKRGMYHNSQKEGIEQYGEILASEIASVISPNNAVRYSLKTKNGKAASCCNLFTSEEYGLAAIYRVIKPNPKLDDIFKYYKGINCEQQFRELLVLDALCFNTDRHLGNFGVLFDNDTLDIVTIAPIYDLNYSFFPSLTTEELSEDKFGDSIVDIKSSFGLDFTELGQLAKNKTISKRIETLADFKFDFRGNDDFSELRVNRIEDIVRKQAQAILSIDKKHTYDVFYSNEMARRLELEQRVKKTEPYITELYDILDSKGYSVSITIDKENSILYVFNDENYEFQISIDFISKTIKWNNELSIEDLKSTDYTDYQLYSKIEEELKEFSSQHAVEELQGFNYLIFNDELSELCDDYEENSGITSP